VFTDVSRSLVVGSVAAPDLGSRAVVIPLSSLATQPATLAATAGDDSPSMPDPRGDVLVGGTSIAVLALVALRRRPRRRRGTSGHPTLRRASVVGLVGSLVVGLVVLAGPAGPTGAADGPCPSQQGDLDADRAILAAKKAAFAASQPTQAQVDNLKALWEDAGNKVKEATNLRNSYLARTSKIQAAATQWQSIWQPSQQDVHDEMTDIDQELVNKLVEKETENLLEHAAYWEGAAQVPPALTKYSGLAKEALKFGRKTAPAVGEIVGGAASALAILDVGVKFGGILNGGVLLVQATQLWKDLQAHPPLTLDEIATLATQRNARERAWHDAQAARNQNEKAVTKAKAVVQQRLGALNQCRRSLGLTPFTLGPDELPSRGHGGAAKGDPHLVTFDGLRYDFQAEGEFWMVRSSTDDFGVQMRTTQGDRGTVAWADGVGVVTPGGHQVAYEPGQVLVDGVAPENYPVVLDDGTTVDQASTYRLEVTLLDGTNVVALLPPSAIATQTWQVGLDVSLADARHGAVTGMLGDSDGSLDGDGRSASGEQAFGVGDLMGTDTHTRLYDDFGPSWLVADADRVLPGEPRAYRAPGPLPGGGFSFSEGEVTAATEACRAAGMDLPPTSEWCVYDSLVTGIGPSDDPGLAQEWIDSIVQSGLAIQADGDAVATADAGNSAELTVLRGATGLVAAASHACAIVGSGEVSCWGSNSNGQLGDGTRSGKLVPTPTAVIPEPVVEVSAGGSETCARTASGGAWCWGDNSFGQIGDGSVLTARLVPTKVVGLPEPILQVVVGELQACAVTVSGGAWCWGHNLNGKLGDGTTTARSTPVPVVGLPEPVTQIDASYSHTCARTVSGGAWCWGANTAGALGDGTTTNRLTPVQVTGLPGPITAISVGEAHTCARTVAGAAWCWGQNTSGILGDGTTTNRSTPVAVIGLPEPIAEVDANGPFHTCARTVSGAAQCWGRNITGELGDGTTINRSTPVAVVGLPEPIIDIETGSYFTCVLTIDSKVWCWGGGTDGELGNGTTTVSLQPVQVSLPT
jgi:alpha-tubulin suppressor-like RCC1 family protein